MEAQPLRRGLAGVPCSRVADAGGAAVTLAAEWIADYTLKSFLGPESQEPRLHLFPVVVELPVPGHRLRIRGDLGDPDGLLRFQPPLHQVIDRALEVIERGGGVG